MRPAEVGAAKVRHPQVQAPVSQLLTLSPGIRPAADDFQNRRDVRCRPFSACFLLECSLQNSRWTLACLHSSTAVSALCALLARLRSRSASDLARSRTNAVSVSITVQYRSGCFARRRVGVLLGGQSFTGEALQRVDAADPHLHFVAAKLLDSFAESLW